MTIERIKAYYDSTEYRETRSDLLLAIELASKPKIAVDCGCGAGFDIEQLVTHGFTVYGYDIESESISRCRERFKNNCNVVLSQDSFSTFRYPRASLVLADASLFFCPKDEFDFVWRKIYESLYTGGIFCGSFVGPDDTMACSDSVKDSIWSSSLVLHEDEVRSLFKSYEICHFTEHKLSGATFESELHNWHIFSVVARKI
jgi:SAM-dependent methyltransferase